MTNSAIAAMKTRSSMVPALLRLKVRIECHDDSQDQQILCWCQANYTRRNFSTPEKARPGPAGIVDPVLQSYNRHSLPIWDAIFECCRVGLHCLCERVTRVDAHHQVGSEISTPGTRVIEIVLHVQRVIADKAREDSSLDG